ncbi:MAG: TRAM domain-containing protein [Candidatus Verstraetearchaeota archaeon]|jgi:predicted RNA-binding protein with TRAM domain|nr:TRAM domain-containing protein [Candidatus Culexarchaeum yellowstonense]MCS7366797.1 TRAM domain-containing protein [Candidatus Culexarchaeum yellowstonense]NHV11857.1 TRAM domain-containing protein [Candidatus Verstraetearchaeota archaeon]
MGKKSSKRKSSKKKKVYLFSRVNEGDVYTVVIEDYSDKGEGIARVKDTAIFVPGAKIGEIVKVKITSVKFKKARGDIISRVGVVQ